MTLLWEGKFNPTDYRIDLHTLVSESWNTYCCLWRSDSFQVVPAPEGRPGYAGRFTLYPGDYCNKPNHDAEFVGIGKGVTLNPGDERWFSFSLYLPSGFSHSTWRGLFELHTNDGGYGNGFLASNLDPNQFNVVWQASSCGTLGIYSNSCQENVGPISFGWTDWLVHEKFTNDQTGFVEYYKNNILVLSRYNIRTIPTKNGNPVSSSFDLMAEIYRGIGDTSTTTTYLYNIKVGTTRADVEYTGSQPPTCPQATLNMVI